MEKFTFMILFCFIFECFSIQSLSKQENCAIETGYRSDKYNDYNSITWYLQCITEDANNGDKMLLDIGNSTEYRTIWRVAYPNNDIPKNRHVWIVCGLIPREYISVSSCMHLIDNLAEEILSPGTNPDAAYLLENYKMIILPLVNPDGYEHSISTEDKRHWMKNMRRTDDDCVGINLGQNFNFMWGGIGGDKNPCSDYYIGPEPHSEAEVQVLIDYYDQTINFSGGPLLALFHIESSGSKVMYPYYYDTLELPSDEKYVECWKNVCEIYNNESGAPQFKCGEASILDGERPSTFMDYVYDHGTKGISTSGLLYTIAPMAGEETPYIVSEDNIFKAGEEVLNEIVGTLKAYEGIMKEEDSYICKFEEINFIDCATESGFSEDQYNEYDVIQSYLQCISLSEIDGYSVTLKEMGKTEEENSIWRISFGKKLLINDNENIFISCGSNPREWISISSCMYMTKELFRASVSGANEKALKLLDNYVINIVPVLNPDGYIYTRQTGPLNPGKRDWAKNRAIHRSSLGGTCTGTYISQNYNASFGEGIVDDDKCDAFYIGSKANSELETQSMVKELNIIASEPGITRAVFNIEENLNSWIFPSYFSAEKDTDYDDKFFECWISVCSDTRNHLNTNPNFDCIEGNSINEKSGTFIDFVHKTFVRKCNSPVLIYQISPKPASGLSRKDYELEESEIMTVAEEIFDGIYFSVNNVLHNPRCVTFEGPTEECIRN